MAWCLLEPRVSCFLALLSFHVRLAWHRKLYFLIYALFLSTFSYLLLCVKVKLTLEQATKVHRESTNIALLSFNFGAGWGEWSKPRPGHFTSRNDNVLIVQWAGWPQCRSGRLRKISLPQCPLSRFCRNQQLSLIWEKRSVIITRQIYVYIYISHYKIYLVYYYFYISIPLCTATCRINGHGSRIVAICPAYLYLRHELSIPIITRSASQCAQHIGQLPSAFRF
jgi:hypothetical protein